MVIHIHCVMYLCNTVSVKVKKVYMRERKAHGAFHMPGKQNGHTRCCTCLVGLYLYISFLPRDLWYLQPHLCCYSCLSSRQPVISQMCRYGQRIKTYVTSISESIWVEAACTTFTKICRAGISSICLLWCWQLYLKCLSLLFVYLLTCKWYSKHNIPTET